MVHESEKRRYERHPFEGTLRLQRVRESSLGSIFEVAEHSIEAAARDISEGGLKVEVGDVLPADSILKVTLAAEPPVEAYVRVVWSRNRDCGLSYLLSGPGFQRGLTRETRRLKAS